MRFRSIILLFIVALLVNGCKKRMFDARNAYTGSWEFQYLITSKQMGQPEVSRSGTYLGRIYYNGRKDAKGIFWMEYAEGQTEGFELRDKTQIFGCGEKFGQFDTRNSLTVTSFPVHSCNLFLSRSTSYTITATRAD